MLFEGSIALISKAARSSKRLVGAFIIVSIAISIGGARANAWRRAPEPVVPEQMRIQPGDLDKPLFIANYTLRGDMKRLMMKVEPMDLRRFKLSHMYWDSTASAQTNGYAGKFYGRLKLMSREPLIVDSFTGRVTIADEYVGTVHRVLDPSAVDTIVVDFIQSFNIDHTGVARFYNPDRVDKDFPFEDMNP